VAGTHVALLRGINVGRAKRVAMADLRALVEQLGYTDVRTMLNSGNVVFTGSGEAPNTIAARIQDALLSRLRISARVMVITAGSLAAIVAGNSLRDNVEDPSRLLVAFLARASDRSVLDGLATQTWSPEVLLLGPQVAYLWCPDGVLASRLLVALGRALGDAVTTRNWATVTKLHALVEPPAPRG
jgi:uncharacterized protein (DUF1697 family)